MMKKLHLYLVLFLLPALSYSQDFTAAAEQMQLIDEFGNYMNNITDKQGLKQGDWFYVDVNGNQIAKKVYKDDKCQSTELFINSQWMNTNNLNTDSKNNNGAIAELKTNGFGITSDRQVLIVLDDSGTYISGNLLGKWNQSDEKKVLSILQKYFSDLNIKSSSKTYILL